MDKNTQNKSINVQLVLDCKSVTDRDRLIEFNIDADKYQNFSPLGVSFGGNECLIFGYEDIERLSTNIDVILDASITNKDQKEAVKELIGSAIVRAYNNRWDTVRELKRRFKNNPAGACSGNRIEEQESLYNLPPKDN